jgi:hypothetical protein
MAVMETRKKGDGAGMVFLWLLCFCVFFYLG